MKLRLKENEVSEIPYTLSREQVSALRSIRFATDGDGRAARVIEVYPADCVGEYLLSARDIVGAFSIGDLQVTIDPKCGNNSLSLLLSASTPKVDCEGETVTLAEGSIVDHLSEQFIQHFIVATSEGHFETYHRHRSVGVRPKGQIDFSRIGSGLPTPVHYVHDEFSSNNVLNSFLASVLLKISYSLGFNSSTGRKARVLLEGLDVSASTQPLQEVETAQYLAPDRAYEDCVRVGAMILTGSGVLTDSGRAPSHGLLFQMSKVFESFVTTVLSDEAGRRGLRHATQGRGTPRYLDTREELVLMPDFLVRAGDGLTLTTVVDAKYKFLGTRPSRADIYQMMAYCDAYEADTGVIIGLGPGQDQVIHIKKRNLRIRYIGVDLTLQDKEPIIAAIRSAL